MENKLLIRIYFLSTAIVSLLFAVLCFVLHWKMADTTVALVTSSVFCMPLVLGLHVLFSIAKKIRASRIFFWMVLMAAIPLLFLIPADFFVDKLPGKTWFLILVGVITAYIAILSNGNSIADLFNSNKYEIK